MTECTLCPQEGSGGKAPQGEEDRLSTGTYSVPPASAPATPLPLTPAPATGCPVHDPAHAHSHPLAHVLNHSHTASSSGGSSRSSAADSQLLHCGICTRRYSNPKVRPAPALPSVAAGSRVPFIRIAEGIGLIFYEAPLSKSRWLEWVSVFRILIHASSVPL